VGKLLLSQILFRSDIYVLRVYDVAAVQRLTKLGYEVRRQHIQPEQIADFIKQHPEWATHPVNGEAFAWNPESSSISLRPLSDRAGNWRYSIPVWTGG
jgi:hypothetical protein